MWILIIYEIEVFWYVKRLWEKVKKLSFLNSYVILMRNKWTVVVCSVMEIFWLNIENVSFHANLLKFYCRSSKCKYDFWFSYWMKTRVSILEYVALTLVNCPYREQAAIYRARKTKTWDQLLFYIHDSRGQKHKPCKHIKLYIYVCVCLWRR